MRISKDDQKNIFYIIIVQAVGIWNLIESLLRTFFNIQMNGYQGIRLKFTIQ